MKTKFLKVNSLSMIRIELDRKTDELAMDCPYSMDFKNALLNETSTPLCDNFLMSVTETQLEHPSLQRSDNVMLTWSAAHEAENLDIYHKQIAKEQADTKAKDVSPPKYGNPAMPIRTPVLRSSLPQEAPIAIRFRKLQTMVHRITIRLCQVILPEPTMVPTISTKPSQILPEQLEQYRNYSGLLKNFREKHNTVERLSPSGQPRFGK